MTVHFYSYEYLLWTRTLMQAYFPLTTFIFSFHGLLSESARLKSFLIPKAFSIAFIRDHQTVKIRFRTVLHEPSCMNRSEGFGDPWPLHNSTFVTISGFCFNSSSKYSNFLPNWSWRFPRLYFSSSGWSRETRIFFWGIISSSKTSSSFGKNSVSKYSEWYLRSTNKNCSVLDRKIWEI